MGFPLGVRLYNFRVVLSQPYHEAHARRGRRNLHASSVSERVQEGDEETDRASDDSSSYDIGGEVVSAEHPEDGCQRGHGEASGGK